MSRQYSGFAEYIIGIGFVIQIILIFPVVFAQNMVMKKAYGILERFATPNIITKRSVLLGKTESAILFHPDITDNEIIREVILVMTSCKDKVFSSERLIAAFLVCAEVSMTLNIDEAVKGLTSGDAIIVVDGFEKMIVVTARKWDKRAISEPPTETVIKGPREGFVEDFKTNLSLIERRLKTPNLAIEKMVVGKQTNTSVAICYLSNIASSSIVAKIKKKIKEIDIDGIIDSFYVETLIEEYPNSFFPQVGKSEKPDIIVSKLLEGRVAIVVDGSPMVLTLPFLFVEAFHSSEDYYERSVYASFLRKLRYVAIIMAIILPGFYISLQIYHYEIIPMRFLITLMNAIKGIPFSPLIEILFVTLLFEVIREASVRMPRAVGMAMSIVGGLVLGETAVKAGLISSPAVMITALSSIALYTIPNQVGTMGLMRLGFIIVGGIAGLYGIMLCSVFLIYYLTTLDSYETPYLAPFAPYIPSDIKDSLGKVALREMIIRPQSIPNDKNPTRQAEPATDDN